MTKKFRLSAKEIRVLAPGHGGCFASDKITDSGERVGYMYRERPDFPNDSGWRFMSGTESQTFIDDAENTGIYDVNTIANYDPEIIPWLDSPTGSAYVREPLSAPLKPEGPA